jgi:3-hydroxyacyl-[acyl-carrier-protein] dehydratase
MLLNYYYSIKNQRTEEDDAWFEVSLLPGCEVYKGHFPGMPVTPGVCNIQMIKECTEALTGERLFLEYIRQCKLTTLITPQQYPELQIRIRLLEKEDACIKIDAVIGWNEEDFLTFKGEFRRENAGIAFS